MNLFRSRRQIFQAQMLDASIALFFSAKPTTKSNDVHYRFRQDSDFFYLTGFAEEDCVLVLTQNTECIYLRDKDPDKETWYGNRLGVEGAPAALQIDEAKDIQTFLAALPDTLKNCNNLYYAFGRDAKRDEIVFSATDSLLRNARKGDFGPRSILHPSIILQEMRLRKSADERALLKAAADITAVAHKQAMMTACAGMYEYEVESIFLSQFRKANAQEAYPTIVAAGGNACILHYTENRSLLKDGELIMIDAGAETSYMNADVSRTFPVGLSFAPAQKDLYTLVLESQKHAISHCKSGNTLDDIHNATVRFMTSGLIDMKILRGSLDENIEKENYKRYYMHRTGHWLGSDVHDPCPYYSIPERKPTVLNDGMVFTVEPGLYLPAGDENVPAELRSTGIRIEDDILIENGKAVNLTHHIPKEIKEIETLRQCSVTPK